MPAWKPRGGRSDGPVELGLDLVGGKWKMPIVWRLADRAWRYGELRRDLGRVTPKMLTQQLRELERDGLVRRTVFPEVPPRVEYAITPIGRGALPVIEALREWGIRYRRRAGAARRRAAGGQSRRST